MKKQTKIILISSIAGTMLIGGGIAYVMLSKKPTEQPQKPVVTQASAPEPTTEKSTTTPAPTPKTPDFSEVMKLNNKTIGWSYAYPAEFVKKYNGVWNIPGNNLYLTFDCGYEYKELTAKTLDILRDKKVKGVFFVTGEYLNSRPDLVRRMAAEGHIVGNHSYGHIHQPNNLNKSVDVVIKDLKDWDAKYLSVVGKKPAVNYFRPPEGALSERSMALLQQLGYKTFLWGAAYKDWETKAQPSEEQAMTALRQHTSPGDVILLHPVSETNAKILGKYIDEYRAKGMSFKLP